MSLDQYQFRLRRSERPSRLKGIETVGCSGATGGVGVSFRKTFPFEGN